MMPPTTETLAKACLNHLRLEEDALRELHEQLSDFRLAFLRGELNDLLSSTQCHDRIANARDTFRRTCVEQFGLKPHESTLGQIVARLPDPWGSQIREERKRMLALAADCRLLSARVTATLACCRSFTRQMLARYKGPSVDRYGPNGNVLGESA